MQYRQDIVTRMPITRVELITIGLLIVTIRSIYLAQLCGRFFWRFGKCPTQICDSCGAIYRCNYETFSSL